jgi:hypothetical protein
MKVLNVNVMGVFNVLKATANHMIKNETKPGPSPGLDDHPLFEL